MEVHESSTRVKAPDTISPDVQARLTMTNEDASLNPDGRKVPDSKDRITKLMNCKKSRETP